MKKLLITGLIIAAGIGLVFSGSSVYAAACGDGTAAGEAMCGVSQANSNTNQTTIYDTVKTIINVLLFVVGIVAVIMIIWGGISYVLSAGAADKAKKARDTILYSVVGLIVAIMAYAIVQFVFSNFSGNNNSGGGSSTPKCTPPKKWNGTLKKCE